VYPFLFFLFFSFFALLFLFLADFKREITFLSEAYIPFKIPTLQMPRSAILGSKLSFSFSIFRRLVLIMHSPLRTTTAYSSCVLHCRFVKQNTFPSSGHEIEDFEWKYHC
jgi:hypothetical protein